MSGLFQGLLIRDDYLLERSLSLRMVFIRVGY